ncbi:MAG TPA: XdhC family protein [Actinomycetota bacterium]|nr:XdhC family protein [Actinomycetota bacterium]
MSEIVDVLSAIETLRAKGEKMALATVVASRGSTYRRPGARLLVAESGDLIGNISGGCLDNDIRREAREVMAGKGARLIDFDLTADDEAVWGWGLGCNGALEVFVEPPDHAAEVIGSLKLALQERRVIGLVTVLTSTIPGIDPGARLLVHPDGRTEGGLGDPDLDAVGAGTALQAIRNRKASRQTLEVPGKGEASAFVEPMEPPIRLLIAGAGEDVIPLVRLAGAIGWETVIADDRENLLNKERFPEATRFVHLPKAIDLVAASGVDHLTAAIVMSHNYVRDQDYLKALLGTDVFYIGMLGPKTRLRRLLPDLAKEGVYPSEQDEAKIHGPAGLDVGAEGPDEIAWAVIAEIMAVRSGRNAGFLKHREGPTHPREPASVGA